MAEPTTTRRGGRLDRVFGPEAKQHEVYAEVDALVRSALDGYDVCVLAYGATGAGKTHTMLADEGIVPSAAKAIAAAARDRPAAVPFEARRPARRHVARSPRHSQPPEVRSRYWLRSAPSTVTGTPLRLTPHVHLGCEPGSPCMPPPTRYSLRRRLLFR